MIHNPNLSNLKRLLFISLAILSPITFCEDSEPLNITPISEYTPMSTQINNSTQSSSSTGRDGVFKVHRIMGYSVAGLSLTTAAVGSMLLSEYSEDKQPSTGLKNTHRVLGMLTAPLAIANAWMGYRNFDRITNEKEGLKKRTLHKWLATAAALGYIATGVLGVMSSLELKDAEKTSEVEVVNYHRATAVGSSLLAISAVVVIAF